MFVWNFMVGLGWVGGIAAADIAEVSEPKYGFSFSYPSACMDHEFFPSSGLIVRLLQADEEDETRCPPSCRC